jgi:hypothetical protein
MFYPAALPQSNVKPVFPVASPQSMLKVPLPAKLIAPAMNV